MDIGLLQQMTRLMTENDLNTVDVRDGDKRVILKRGVQIAPGGSPGFVPQYAPVAANPGAPSAAAPSASEDSSLVQIKSPMVGTFYSSSSPEAKPFVTVGSEVDEDTEVCIIEAMKVFNTVKGTDGGLPAGCRGTIAKILVENGATVEFGQVLFMVKPS